MGQRKFREDLYYRLVVTRLKMPPLRDRIDDIPLLTQHLISRIGIQLHRPIDSIEKSAIQRLQSYSWPGNVRELENVLTRAIALTGNDCLCDADIKQITGDARTSEDPEILSLREMEKRHIEKALNKTSWNITKTAELLEISPTTVRKKIEDYKITQQ